MEFLKKHLMWILLGELVVIIILAVVGGYYIYHINQELQVNNTDTSGAIFSVATSTGATYFTVTSDGKVGIDTESPTSELQVNGAIRMTAKSPEGCGPDIEGTIAYNPDNKAFWGCNGIAWNRLDN